MNVENNKNNQVDENIKDTLESAGYHTIQIDEGIPFRTLNISSTTFSKSKK